MDWKVKWVTLRMSSNLLQRVPNGVEKSKCGAQVVARDVNRKFVDV